MSRALMLTQNSEPTKAILSEVMSQKFIHLLYTHSSTLAPNLALWVNKASGYFENCRAKYGALAFAAVYICEIP